MSGAIEPATEPANRTDQQNRPTKLAGVIASRFGCLSDVSQTDIYPPVLSLVNVAGREGTGPAPGLDPDHDRPRERLRRHGCVAASDVDLLAVIIGSGTRDSKGPVSAVDLGHGLLRRHKSLRSIASLEVDELMGISGLGPAKSTAIVAAFEMGRRVAAESVLPQEPIRGPKDVFLRFAPFMRDLPREVFNVVLLNTAARVIRTFTASEGGLAASIVEPRIVFRRAILANAASIICLHNHPSGNSEPSKEDIQITSQLKEAGRVLGIPLQDHLIIAGDGFTSLAERGLI